MLLQAQKILSFIRPEIFGLQNQYYIASYLNLYEDSYITLDIKTNHAWMVIDDRCFDIDSTIYHKLDFDTLYLIWKTKV